MDARCAALVAEAARRSEVQPASVVTYARKKCRCGPLDARGPARELAKEGSAARLRRMRPSSAAFPRDEPMRSSAGALPRRVALNRWRVAAGARTRAIAALRAYGLHLNARGRADALRRSLATWRRACDGGALRLQLEARDAAAARAAADAAAEIRAVREEVNDAVRAATQRA